MTCLLFEGDSFAKSAAYLHAAKKSGRDIDGFLESSPTSAALLDVYESALAAHDGDKNAAKKAVMTHWVNLPSSLAYASMILEDLGLLTRHRDDFKRRYDLTKTWDAKALNVGSIKDYMTPNDIDAMYADIKAKDGITPLIAAHTADIEAMQREKETAALNAAPQKHAHIDMH